MKDIFIDADVACKIHKPLDGYSDFVQWLLYNGSNKDNNAYLVVSHKIIQDWFGRPGSSSATKNSIAAIYEQLNREDRLNRISNDDLKEFCKIHFKQKVWDSLTCKRKDSNDPYHFMAIHLSDRKMALIEDGRLKHDLLNIKLPKLDVKITVDSNPNNLDYK